MPTVQKISTFFHFEKGEKKQILDKMKELGYTKKDYFTPHLCNVCCGITEDYISIEPHSPFFQHKEVFMKLVNWIEEQGFTVIINITQQIIHSNPKHKFY